LFVLLFLISPCFAIDKITVDEGTLIKLKIDAYDLDNDKLEYFFPEPFNENGEWQTNYTDAGIYNFTIAVSDGKDISYRQVQIIIKDKDRPPVFVGLKDSYVVKENETLNIELNATDPDGDEVDFIAVNLPDTASFSKGVFEWKPDFDTVAKDNTFKNKVLTKLHLYNYFRKKEGKFNIVFVAKGKEESTKKDVKIIVKDVNRPPVLKELKDIIVTEGEKIELEPEAIDPDNDVLTFSYSGFMNSDSYKTNYDDAGNYTVTVKVTDGKETVSQDVKVVVKNENRAPEFKKIKDKVVYENQTIKFELKAEDKDNDKITYSAEQMPDGANLSDNVFTYTPDFDVTNSSKTYIVTFIAADSETETKQKAKITVRNVNRKPVIEEFSNITKAYINEPAKFSVNATDPDGDSLTYKWVFGLFDSYVGSNYHIRKFTTPGIKTVKVIVSDGESAIVQKWKVDVREKAKPVETVKKVYKTYIIE